MVLNQEHQEDFQVPDQEESLEGQVPEVTSLIIGITLTIMLYFRQMALQLYLKQVPNVQELP
ncbi:hypothetical protein [Avrilella dinanensis]|uniref:hypothetical protein n=1 Tax=Avrilella dinanensis TaxID=2008672 RepID=UPI0010555ED8|nr:hypothetical protein [Avrilella dinanensis]